MLQVGKSGGGIALKGAAKSAKGLVYAGKSTQHGIVSGGKRVGKITVNATKRIGGLILLRKSKK
jgi:hypothetical protein